MAITRDTLIIVGIVIAVLCALVSIGVALWELGRAWWTPDDSIVEREPDALARAAAVTPWGMTGIVWPMPGSEPVGPNPAWASTFRAAGITWVRMDVPVSRDRANARGQRPA